MVEGWAHWEEEGSQSRVRGRWLWRANSREDGANIGWGCVNLNIKSVEKQIELVSLVHATVHSSSTLCLLEARDGLHSTPHLSCIVLLEFVLQLPPVMFLPLPDLHLQLPLDLSHLLQGPSSEGPLLLIVEVFDVPCDPWLVVGKTIDSLRWTHGVHTEVDVIYDALRETVYVRGVQTFFKEGQF